MVLVNTAHEGMEFYKQFSKITDNKTGYIRTLQVNDLFDISDTSRADVMAQNLKERLDIRWKQYEKTHEKKYSYKPIVWALHDVFWKQFWLGSFFVLMFGLCGIAMSLVVKYFIEYAAERIDPTIPAQNKPPMGKGIAFSIILIILVIMQSLSYNQTEYTSQICGARMRAALISVMHQKYSRISPQSRREYPPGKMTNLVSIDAHKLDMAVLNSHIIIMFTPVIGTGIVVLMLGIGVSGFAGIGIVASGVGMTVYFAKLNINLRTKVVRYTDERVSILREILESIKLLKLYAWELAYSKRIGSTRDKEESNIKYIALSSAFSNALSGSVSNLAGLVAFIVFVTIGHEPSASKMFSALGIFDVILPFMAMLPRALTFVGDALVSLKRINKFFFASEIDSYVNIDRSLGKSGLALKVEGGKFTWQSEENSESDEKSQTYYLNNINLEINQGDLVVIAGVVGSGKSSLLHAIAGQMDKLAGTVSIASTPTLCMDNWSLNTSIKDNIIFNREFDEQWYEKVIEACCLTRDFESFTHGDRTITGEKGITLSGGQKARVALARAVYSNSDIYIFEDILSAVDPYVAAEIISKCLCGLLSHKTVIIATHHMKLAKTADMVIYMDKESSSAYSGTLNDILQTHEGFNQLMSITASSSDSTSADTSENEKYESSQNKQNTKASNPNRQDESSEDQLIEEEDRAQNAVSLRAYLEYLSSPGTGQSILTLSLVILCFLVFSALQSLRSLWIGWWTDDRFHQPSKFYIGIYASLLGPLLLSQTGLIFLTRFHTLKCNSFLHLDAIQRMLRAPLSFFNANPIGRILNRFTKDVDALDNEIAVYMMIFAVSMGTFLSHFVMVCIFVPYVAALVIPVAFVFALGTGFYRRSAREVKRLDALLRSEMMTKLNETINGMTVIVSYGDNCTQMFHKNFNESVDKMNRAYFLTTANQAWLAFRLDLSGTLVTVIATLLVATDTLKLQPGEVGIVVSVATAVINTLSMALTGFAEMENCMNSAERLIHYRDKIPQERLTYNSGIELAKEWPSNGSIEFKNASMRYRPELPAVMKNINLSINGGERVAICGRTGAGKSSILMTLFRIQELCEGSITIDGLDIGQVDLSELRKRLSIIPQESVLFKGTVRSNLDPLNEYSEARLIAALSKCGIYSNEKKSYISSEKFALDYVVENGGSNFSQGEKQMMALARAVIRDVRILVLDEATSSVDYITDQHIQHVLAMQFKNCTVICVAHRLQTIMDYDKVAVLDNGGLMEYGSPAELFDRNGYFRSMCDTAGVVL